jgi:GrpB-like predicted nucleotidyltransferase (UPF0157 family)
MSRDLAAVTIGALAPLDGKIRLETYDPAWPRLYAAEAAKVRAGLGAAALEIHHVGSTSVSGLSAKPVIDMLLVVADSADEDAYGPPLEAGGYVLRIREPDWFEHRLFRGVEPSVNLHVLSAGCDEIHRMLAFRDRLRADTAERDLYEAEKRRLADREWRFTQDYADAKTAVVQVILSRALAARPL